MQLDSKTAVAMIQAASSRLADEAAELSRLDAVAGDGDHGLNVSSAFSAAASRIANRNPANPGEAFLSVGQAFSEGRGGASGALFGAFFAALGDRLGVRPAADVADLVSGMEVGSRRLSDIGQANVGDKTMLDALQPAVDASRLAFDDGGDLIAVLAAAAAAAEQGAGSTAEMRAKAGRARYAPDAADGTQDPGAATLAIMFRAWADAVAHQPDGAAAPPIDSKRLAVVGERASRPETTVRANLAPLATESGHFAILALDHVRSFAVTMRPDDPDSLTSDEMRESKQRIIEHLGPSASAVLIDPVHVLSTATSALPNGAVGLIMGVEDADYKTAVTEPRLLPGWTVERAAERGADAVKISLYFDPDQDTSVAERFVADVAGECDRFGLPLFCEPLVDTPDPSDRRRKILEGVRRFGCLGVTVLKIQFPHDTRGELARESWAEACQEADDLSATPWAILSEGREFEEFRELLSVACRAGASGFVAGRAIWGGLGMGDEALATSAQRLAELRSIAVSEGAPWDRRATTRAGREGA